MRINELKLIAYGKFTDHLLSFPKAEHDFHVIIGPNEAGKSTVRKAITELLFGMHRQSPLGFKHPQSDLRLSAVLETGSGPLSFIRSKQQKSLRSMADDPLPDTYLDIALGSLTEDIFEQLHCLNHEQLIKGGQGIIDPRNSVSQILFQAASGLEGFAAIRDELSTRAGELFATRGRNNEYAKAAERFTAAQKSLREAQVRTKEWVEARDSLQHAEEQLQAERKHRRELETQRSTWERVRRLAPLVERLARLEQELQALGDTIAFPSNAKETLDSGISDLNAATSIVKTRERDVLDRQQQLQDIHVDDKVLGLSASIERLARLCGLYANHASDLPLRRQEVQQWLNEVLARSTDFGWGSTEEEVRAQLPDDRILRSIDSLLKALGALRADERAATAAAQERESSMLELQSKLEALPHRAVNHQLPQALEQALPYKTTETKQKNLQGLMAAAERSAANAIAVLGDFQLTVDALRTMQLPSAERVAAYRTQRHSIAQARDLARSLAQQDADAVAALELQIAQFTQSHKVVTIAEVSGARSDRDEQWNAIKFGLTSLSDSAPRLDAAIRLADELVDARTRAETDGATLQALRDQRQKSEQDHQRHQQSVKEKTQELEAFDAQWAEQASRMGLAGIELDDMPEWLTERDTAIQAADLLEARKQEYEFERHHAAHAQHDLREAIVQAGLEVNPSFGLAALCTVAEAHIKETEQTHAERHSLTLQLNTARNAWNAALKAKEVAKEALEQWELKWNDALAKAHLSQMKDDATEIEAAVEAARFVRQHLEKIASHRSERIEAMENDLQQLQDEARTLAQAIAPELVLSGPNELSRALLSRLEDAKQQLSRKAQAQEFLDTAQRQLSEARSTLEQTRLTLEPLLQAACVQDPMLALPLVQIAQQKDQLVQAAFDTKLEIENGSDGRSLEHVQAEVASHSAMEAPEQLLALRDALADSEQKQTQLLQTQIAAQQTFDAIDGGSQAAEAEAQKQEALSDMSSVGEEYLQHATASCLLKWAVDRYRDRKQGPLLQHASAIFKNLTLGSFEKLRIDYDQAPPALLAYRPHNQAVKISGLSDGTRDQLFLALRIAALELQAEQGAAVPFIADDLFINFDDKRSQAGLQALHTLSTKTQVLFLSHQEHLLPQLQQSFPQANIITLETELAS
ncbi:AAA family ATPase [Ottowia caeni]|uniref:AAA family ATPase n=1 Tax=Ottowia caeni TaxID=2870339 RepID=UPI003D7030F3|nr:AAA family ATPase [Ottowia caeni]